MKISNLTMVALCILCCGTAGLCNTQPAEQGVQQRIQIQEQRLAEIAQMAARQRADVEQWHADQQVVLAQEIARRAAARISLADRSLWVEFGKVHSGESLPQEYFDADYYAFPLSPATAVLRNIMIDEYLVGEMANLLLSEDFAAKLAMVVDEQWQIPWLRKEAAKLLDLSKRVREEVRAALANLDYRASARIEAITLSESDLKEQVAGILNFLRRTAAKEAKTGTVLGVGCSAEGGCVAEIEGVNQELRPGDTIRGVRVLEIGVGTVRFSKNGAIWTQEVGALAPASWD